MQSSAESADTDVESDRYPALEPALPVTDRRGKRRASAPLDPDAERYALGEQIGRGGMGEVIAAHDIQIGRDVAIKRLRSQNPSDAALARFLREARIQGRLEHPAIPPVHELAHDEEGRPYFAMRKLAGVTMADTLRDPKSPFTRQRLLRAFIEVCNAIEVAHTQRIIHRDLKPGNILFGEHGEVYVLDWGIARELDAPDAFAGAILGTPGYMAPEQLRGQRDLDERVDIYSLGCILFEIVERHPEDIPLELAEACRRATQLQRRLRYSSARELRDVVQRFLDGDRDLEQRRRLARRHLAGARAAFARTDVDEMRRSIVMREAGKALALDPTIDGAAELIGRLMLEPPSTMPSDVHRVLEDMDMRASRAMAQLSLGSSTVFSIVFVIFLVFGMTDRLYVPLFGAGSFAMAITAFTSLLANTPRALRVLSFVWITLMIAMVALLSRMFTPILVAPTIATLALGTLPFNPLMQGRGMILATAGALLATLGVWAAELLGAFSQTVYWTNGAMVLKSPVEGIGNIPVFPLLFFVYALTIVMGSAVGYVAMRAMQRSRAQLALQAWHLRQLV